MGALTACGGSGNAAKTTEAATDTEAAKEDTKEEKTEAAEEGADTTLGLKPLDERTTLSIGFFAGSAHSMPWYVADEMGFFDELNIDVEYQSFTGGPAMMEASADWDVCDVGAPGVLNGMKNYDINMLGVCDNEFNTALFVRPDTDLAKDPKNPDNWKGKKVLLNRGTTLQYMFMAFMNSIGIDDLDAYGIEIVDTAVGTCLTAFQTGEGDAMCVWNAFACQAEENGYVRVTDIKDLGLNNISAMCATKDAIENKTELVETAFQVYYKTWEWCNESEENMAKAEELFVQSCEDEGVAVTEDIAKRLIEEYNCPTLSEAVSAMTTEEDDRNGSGNKVTKATNQLFETLDFFITLGNYTEEDRQTIQDKGLVNPVIAEAVK
ncbi:ABC transporter substrate-binding protein [Clostridium sp. OM02-18AC]|nr:ABC transporter substrate-binding protein [Clostridium sp. AF32-12BH]RHV66900.1 ABC transporter substrate-binding protein [Clostridium sp. OM02-18AC]